MNDLHRTHDPVLIAAFAAGHLDGHDRHVAASRTVTCAGCGVLARDLGALVRAVRELPPVRRPRDFTLSPAAAARVRRPLWRRTLAALSRDRLQLARPVGATLAALGLAGLLVSAVPAPGPVAAEGQAAAAPATVDTMSRDDTSNAGPGTAQEAPGAQSPAPLAAQEREGSGGAPAGPDAGPAAPVARALDSTLVVLSGSFLIVGLGLLGFRWTADRLGDG